jgi:putative ABC transport system permease protein
MSMLDALRYRIALLRRARARDEWRAEMDAELRHHLELEAMHGRHAGLSAEESERAARQRLGDPRRVRERIVDESGLSAFDALRQDLTFAWRALRRRPGFTLVAVLTIGIGIGANVAIFSAVDAMLLRALPFGAPEQLMKVDMTRPASGDQPAADDKPWSYPKYAVLRDAQGVFSRTGIYTDVEATLRSAGTEPERARGEVVDAGYLPTLGVAPTLGRGFTQDEERLVAAPRVVLLSDALWQRRFGGAADVLGRTLDVGGESHTIVGVLPPGFRGLSGRADYWRPVASEGEWMVTEAWNHSFTVVARRKPGITEATASAVVRQLGQRVDAAFPDQEDRSARHGAVARPLDAARVDPLIRRALLVLSGAVGLVLLVACANVANLLLVRAAGRHREIAVRIAIGAGRRRLVRQLLTESLLLATLGGAVGVAIAWGGTRALAAIDPSSTLRLQSVRGLGAVSFADVRLDLPALLVALGLTLATGLLFGLVPALQTTRSAVAQRLRDGAPGSGDRGPARARTRTVLAIAEVTLALVLLAGAGLMMRSLGRLLDVSPGVDPSRMLTLRIGAPPDLEPARRLDFLADVRARIGALPGVTGVTIQDCPPLNGGCSGTVLWRRDRPEPPPDRLPSVGVHWITPEWPTVMRVPVLRGRGFTDADRAGSPKVVLVSLEAARRYWPGEDPIGRPVSVGQGGFHQDTARIVGIVADVRYATLDSQPRPDVYLTYAQSPAPRAMLFVRTRGEPTALTAPVRAALRAVSPDLVLYDVRTMDERVGRATAFTRFSATLLTLFAGIALALAALGIYGVIAAGVAQRTREIGIRVALGATRGDVLRLVVAQGVGIAALGTAFGLLGALAATRLLRSLLYDVAPSDPTTFAGIVALLALVAIAASGVPAWRASSIRPTEVLKEA